LYGLNSFHLRAFNHSSIVLATILQSVCATINHG
jgi:hypothetical protein